MSSIVTNSRRTPYGANSHSLTNDSFAASGLPVKRDQLQGLPRKAAKSCQFDSGLTGDIDLQLADLGLNGTTYSDV